jgi:hypothetical protein
MVNGGNDAAEGERGLTPHSCYKLLGLAEGAAHREVQEAYRRLAFKLHPDIAGDDPTARAEFVRITQAYRTISMLDRLQTRSKRAGCCARCGTVEEVLFLGLDRRRYCPECLLESRRRLLPLPVIQTVRCVSVMALQVIGLLSAVQYLGSGRVGFAVTAIAGAAVSLILLGYFVFSADQIET